MFRIANQSTTTTTAPSATGTTASSSANQELIDQLTTLETKLPFATRTNHHHHSLKHHHHEQANPSLKLDMMSQLLCSQALLESDSFKPLSYDQFNQFKKSITKLEHQLQPINSKINLELKILETTNILQSDLTDTLYQFPAKFKRLHEQKESIQSQLTEQQTSLLQHLAAVLAQGFKRLEQQLLNSNPHSSFHHQPSPLRSPSPAPTTLSSRSATLSSRFDGPHLFANNQTRPTLQNPHRAKEPTDRFPFNSPSSSSSPKLNNNNYTNNNLLKEEIESLKALLNARDAIVAEQAADLSLLELEVETLKQSLSDQSSNHQQLASARSSSERNTQKELDSLKAKNAQLTEELQSSKKQTESSNDELTRLKKEVEIMHSDRQLERMSELNETLATRARDAEEHTREIESAKAELETQLVALKADLEAARRSNETVAQLESQLAVLEIDLQAARLSKDSALDERDSLKKNLEAYQNQIEALSSELEILRTSAAEQTSQHDRQCAALEATHRDEWKSLASMLIPLRSKLDDKMSPKLAQFLSQPHDPAQPKKFAEELVNCLEQYMTITHQLLASQQDLGPALRAELEEARRTHDQQTVELTSRLQELEEQKTQLQQRIKELETAQEQQAAGQSGKVDASELDAVKRELMAVKQQLVTAREQSSTSVENRLREIWRILPPNLEARGAASLDSDLSGFKAVYEQSKKVASSGVAGGLGGLFGLGKRTPTPTAPSTAPSSSSLSANDEQEFSVDNTLEKLKLLVENDKKLVDRLFKYEAEKDSHKSNSIRAQKLVAESQDALRVYQSQVKELEERLEYADTQSAAMLEKVNDLMESEEKANMVARRATSTIQQYQREIAELKAQLLSQQQAGAGGGGAEPQLKHQIQDLQAQVLALQAREIAQRDQFQRDIAHINGRP